MRCASACLARMSPVAAVVKGPRPTSAERTRPVLVFTRSTRGRGPLQSRRVGSLLGRRDVAEARVRESPLLYEMADRKDERFQVAAARWHARFVLEANLPLREAEGVMM